MRLLIYGMQSSGASTLAFLLGQKRGSGAFVDIWTMYAAPSLDCAEDVVAKVVVTTSFPLAMHQERFQPDRTILFLRHPLVNYRSLASKSYRHHCGFMEEKFPILDEVWNDRTAYDAVLHYEDLIFDPLKTMRTVSALGWRCDPGFLKLARSHEEMVAFNEERFPSVTERLQYGAGQYRGGSLKMEHAGLTDLSAASPVDDWCPEVVAHYRDYVRRKRTKWREALAQGKDANERGLVPMKSRSQAR